MHAQLGQIIDNKIQKRPGEPYCHLEELGAKAGCCACALHKAPPRRWADHLSHPSNLIPEPALTLTLYKEPFIIPLENKRGNLLLAFASSHCSMNSHKALPEIFVWPLINFY